MFLTTGTEGGNGIFREKSKSWIIVPGEWPRAGCL